MLKEVKNPLNAGPSLQNVKDQPDQIRGPTLVQIYQAPPKKPEPPKPVDGGFACHVMNNTVTKEVLESLGGIKDTIRPIATSLTTHEMRPYEIQRDYRQTVNDMRKEDQESVRASMSCLRGDPDVDAPRPLYRHDDDEEITNGINMIGKARLVSASPFRATVKVDRDAVDDAEQKNQNSDDEEFEREELPELNRIKESPIKDDSELLRH